MENCTNYYKDKVTIEVDTKLLGQGTFSLAYNCNVTVLKQKAEFKMVLKRPKIGKNKKYFLQSIKKNLITISLSREFNRALAEFGINKCERIYFTRVLYLTLDGKGHLLESYIPGNFVKYSNNDGYVNESVSLMSAFSHFTYDFTEGEVMVVDL